MPPTPLPSLAPPIELQPPLAFDVFMNLSAILTGFDQADLLATGMGETYYSALFANAGRVASGALFQAFAELQAKYPVRDQVFLDAFAQQIMIPFGPLAQNITMMWYCGRWNQLPSSWRERYSAFASDQDQIISPEAYVQGLVWKAIDSHPRGAKQPGYGTWTTPPNVPSTIPHV